MTNETSTKLKNGGWGLILGAVVAIILGFSWGGWVTASTAMENSEEAVLASKAKICVAQFMMTPDYDAQLVKYKETETWLRRDFIEKGGWDKMPGEETARTYVSNGCVEQLDSTL